MNAAEVLRYARGAGVSVRFDGDRLRVGAAGPAPEAVIVALRQHKDEIIELLRPPTAFAGVFAALERGAPAYIEDARWWQACEDGRKFLATWGDRAVELGWSPRELFGLHSPPSNPHPSYARLSRYDETGLIGLLDGKVVTALTATTADIQHKTGAITVYRKLNKPALGPLGDSLEDFV